jgi:hypothetical protein
MGKFEQIVACGLVGGLNAVSALNADQVAEIEELLKVSAPLASEAEVNAFFTAALEDAD